MVHGKKETFKAFLYNGMSKVATYLLILIFANLYSQQDYGLGNFALNIRNLVTIIAFIGLPDALVPLIVRKKDINSSVKIILFLTLIGFIAGLVLMSFQPWTWPLVLTFPLTMFSTLSFSFWRARSRHDMPVKIAFYSLFVVIIAAYILKGFGAFGVIMAYSLGNVYGFLFLVLPIRKEIIKSFSGNFVLKDSFSYLKTALIASLILNSFLMFTWIISTFLGILGTYEQVAQFGVASALAGVISIIPITLSMFLVTRASQVKDKIKSRNILHRVIRVSFFASLLSSILMISLVGLIIKVFFIKYQGIEYSVAILTLGSIFFASYYIVYSYFIGKMQTGKAILPISFGLILSVILSIILIPSLGLIGASLAYSSSHLIILLTIAIKEKLRRITLTSVFSIFLIYICYKLSYLGILVFLALIPLSILFKIITTEDINIIKETILKSTNLSK
jgi:stage V sporulation protein B